MVIPECEEFSKFNDVDLKDYPNKRWFGGDNKSKGVGIFAKSTYKFRLHERYNDKFKYIIPIKVEGQYEFTLFGIWAMNDKVDSKNKYIAQVGSAIKYYNDLLLQDCILIGDFNSNVIWDNESTRKYFTHTDVINLLNTCNIKSIFHQLNNQKYGKELISTFYMYTHQDRGYHTDYAYCSNNLFNRLLDFSIGEYNDWINYSDHMPLIVEFS